VRIEDGPLAGLEGILVETPKRQRVVVSLTLLRRSVAVAIERHWAAPVDVSGLAPIIDGQAIPERKLSL
jgi:hypothetical protein